MGGRHVRLYYATQAERPPADVLHQHQPPAEVGVAYRRFLVNQFRKAYGFEGTPVRLVFRAHSSKRQAPPPGWRRNAPAPANPTGAERSRSQNSRDTRNVAENENGELPRLRGSEIKSAGANRYWKLTPVVQRRDRK